jgi:aspartate kinase
MSLVVQKYGGTSVDGAERMRAVAKRIAATRAAGADTVVVVSAMGHTTDSLIDLANQVSSDPHPRELDMLLTTGERIAMALLAMALHDLGVEAISFTGSQSGILTDATHRAARIVAVRPDRIRRELERGQVVIVAGFQGVNPDTKEITTLGRGGSDTTAVALAAALGPGACEIYTDVDGVLTADPRVVPEARVIPRLGYSLCSTLAHLGGRVLHARCVDLAAAHRVPLSVRSSFTEAPGTRIEGDDMEGKGVRALALRESCSVVVATGTSGGRGEARGIIDAVAQAQPELELVAHEQATDAHGAIVWIGEREPAEALKRDFNAVRGPGGEWRLDVEHGVAFVSLVGLGLGAADVVRAESALERAAVPIQALRVTPTALILRVPGERGQAATKALHQAFLGETAAGTAQIIART